ncbi:MAG: chemotaxis protein CheW, partial [Halorhabdus sp.]
PADGTPTTTAAGTDSAQTADTSSTEGSAIGDDDALAAVAAAARAASEFEGDARPASQTEDNSPDPSSGTTAADSPESEGREEATRDTRADRTRVLAFRVGEERYCLDIEYVEEIVREETVTRVPNTPEYVEGVVDLRGQITTILDPKTTIGIEDSAEEQLIIVFDAETFDDHGYIGWLVDEVDQVMPITHSDVKDAPVQESYINGVIEDDGEFVIWTTPELALDVDEE